MADERHEAAEGSESDTNALLCGFEEWLRSVCFQKPTPEAYDLAKCAWVESAKRNSAKYECPICCSDDIEVRSANNLENHICRDCCYEWTTEDT